MCFVKGTDKFHAVAETDLKCYKLVLRRNDFDFYMSPYRGSHYALGKLLRKDVKHLDIVKLDLLDALESDVYHSYHTTESAAQAYRYIMRYKVTHYYDSWGVCVLECIIPKGSLYWMNDTEYASTAIKPVREMSYSEL